MNELSKKENNELSVTNASPLVGKWIANDKELAIATTLAEKRIGRFDSKDMAELVGLMAKWKLMLGSNTEATEQELIFVCQFIYDEFPQLTLTDVKMCMNMVISGKLDVSFVSTKSLSANYVSKCLNVYEDYKAETINRIAQNKEKLLLREEIDNPKPVSAADKMNIFKEYFINVYKGYKDKQVVDDRGGFTYKWLKHVGLIMATQQNITDAMNYANDRYILERNQNFSLFTKAIEKDVPINEKEIKKRFAREYLIANVFDKYSFVQLIELIKIDYFETK